MFSKACEYGIKAAIFIALKSYQGERVSLKDIAAKINSPEAFTAKILQKLAKNNIVNSVKGATGGFEIEKHKIASIQLAEIVDAIDGDSIYIGCGLGLNKCSEDHPCPVHHKFAAVREELKKMLESTNLEELALGIKSGASYLRT
ncbi:Rrf2 family transcriptional regulator [Aquimarina sp. AU58]|uniref:RrF2 family transcriptional regulator n=1 Tax=Aquimarina sp. AU58 TaxID=1874112 RepID=UPI000D6DD8D5|nr:Rrf2 family transcriptional regulator [Aquimarina sp. AU58]